MMLFKLWIAIKVWKAFILGKLIIIIIIALHSLVLTPLSHFNTQIIFLTTKVRQSDVITVELQSSGLVGTRENKPNNQNYELKLIL